MAELEEAAAARDIRDRDRALSDAKNTETVSGSGSGSGLDFQAMLQKKVSVDVVGSTGGG